MHTGDGMHARQCSGVPEELLNGTMKHMKHQVVGIVLGIALVFAAQAAFAQGRGDRTFGEISIDFIRDTFGGCVKCKLAEDQNKFTITCKKVCAALYDDAISDQSAHAPARVGGIPAMAPGLRQSAGPSWFRLPMLTR